MMTLRSVMVVVVAMVTVVNGYSDPNPDKTVVYFASVRFACDSMTLNVSDHLSQVAKMYWILTDGTLVDTASKLPENMVLSSNAYYLNISKVNDPTFGYYHCIIQYKNSDLKVVRRGLNINGPDFTALHDQYRHNAMIGGIAAAVLVAILGCACLIYHFRFQDREDDIEELYKMHDDDAGIPPVQYDNEAIELEEKARDDKTNGAFNEKL